MPAIMQWWDGFSAVVDLTNPTGRKWFKSQLDRLMEKYGVDGFKFDGGDAPYYTTPQCSAREVAPKPHTERACGGVRAPRPGLSVERIPGDLEDGRPAAGATASRQGPRWADLRKLIPGILNQGIMGYAFTCPDMIGGGEYLSFQDASKLDEELVVRAAQVHALMPMMQFSVGPGAS